MGDVNISPRGGVVEELEVEIQALQHCFIGNLVMSMGSKAIWPMTVPMQALFLEERLPILEIRSS